MIRRIIVPILKINYLFLAPWILLSLPSAALFQQTVIIIAGVAALGLGGMVMLKPSLVTVASMSLLLALVWGKIASDLYGLAEPDSAVLLFQFMILIFLMEASKTALTFDSAYRALADRTDETTMVARMQVSEWARTQLLSLGRLTIAAFFLSLGLLLMGDLVSIPVNQLALSGILVVAAVAAILILLIYRREPEQRQ